MPANKKPRKKYRPKFPPGQIVLPKNIRYSQANELMLQLIPHQELERLRDGTADEGTWHTLTMRLDWGLFMAIDHFEDDVAVDMVKAYRANARDGLKGQIAGMQATYRLFLDRVEL